MVIKGRPTPTSKSKATSASTSSKVYSKFFMLVEHWLVMVLVVVAIAVMGYFYVSNKLIEMVVPEAPADVASIMMTDIQLAMMERESCSKTLRGLDLYENFSKIVKRSGNEGNFETLYEISKKYFSGQIKLERLYVSSEENRYFLRIEIEKRVPMPKADNQEASADFRMVNEKHQINIHLKRNSSGKIESCFADESNDTMVKTIASACTSLQGTFNKETLECLQIGNFLALIDLCLDPPACTVKIKMSEYIRLISARRMEAWGGRKE